MDPPVNLYFGNNLKKSILADEDNSKNSINYIIFQNDFFHKHNKELLQEIHELTNKIQFLEDDNEFLEISKNSLKGFIKNEAEITKLSKNLITVYDSTMSCITKHEHEIEFNIKLFGSIIVILEFIILIYRIYGQGIYLMIDTVVKIIIIDGLAGFITRKFYLPYSEIIKIKNIKNMDSVLKIKKELNNASKGNDYLSELIDKF